LGECWPIVRFLDLDFLKLCIELAHILGQLFSMLKVKCVFILTKCELGYIFGDFLQTHLVTLKGAFFDKVQYVECRNVEILIVGIEM
jgi:hypothetical protein